MIHTVTNLPEISPINNKISEFIAMKFENDWLDRYLRPERCIQDKGGELTGIPFIHMLVLNGIKNGTITVKNPEVNAICERLHQSISNSLSTSYFIGSSSNQGISSSEYCGYMFCSFIICSSSYYL